MTSKYTTYTDGELLQFLKNGDEKAFTEVYERYWEGVSLYVLKIIRVEEDARDIVQELFTSLWKRREELLITTALAPYLFGSVRNLALRYIQHNIRNKHFLETFPVVQEGSSKESPGSLLELKELNGELNEKINRLPEKMRIVYRLSREEDLSHREIASQLHIAETTVKKQVQNALKLIKQEVISISSVILALFSSFL